MRTIKRLVILALAVCMLWGMTASVMAASSDETGETSTFTFTNEGATGDGSGYNGDGTTGGTTGSGSGGTTGTPSGTTGSGSGGSGSTSGAKTADVDTGAYAACAAIAGAGAAVLLGVSLTRKHRYGKEGR